ncbi:RNA polymerase sigma-70 factor, ECF subfamily [Nocardioides alpinus]|uniref:RNA polymerase sigma-70 factor, ECF subfamily n=1 Tax=Nocardioides alpinus TaxID=748909 RepID=A0A1I0ZE90_9ACTN|nr:sigma-70 family RNA polymerase sigma factor [Nocardioides alpinus]PKH40640.1 RNA polymerase subunit sigma [Nocardioides alpinus]SFB23974.1 RNA polymerase sigma-70 factor, ECF subfamily [Nocardioides alpinus]
MPTPRHHDPDPLTASLLRAAAGDTDAFTEVYDEVGGRVYGITLRVVRDHHQAEEVAQETMIEVWRSCSRFDPSRGSAGAWISTMAHHRAVDRVRSSSAARRRDTSWHGEGSEAGTTDSTFQEASSHFRTRSIFAALMELPPTQRRAIELAYFGGHTYADVAQLMQAPLGTTKTRIRNALRLLREKVDASLIEIA